LYSKSWVKVSNRSVQVIFLSVLALTGVGLGHYVAVNDTGSTPRPTTIVQANPATLPTPTPTSTVIVEVPDTEPIKPLVTPSKSPIVQTPTPTPLEPSIVKSIKPPDGWVSARYDEQTNAQVWATPEMSKSNQGEMFIFEDGGWIKLTKIGNSVTVESGLGKSQAYFKVFHASNRAGNRKETDIIPYKLGETTKKFQVPKGKYVFARPIQSQDYQLMLDTPQEIR
jgi:hypothetical protein